MRRRPHPLKAKSIRHLRAGCKSGAFCHGPGCQLQTGKTQRHKNAKPRTER